MPDRTTPTPNHLRVDPYAVSNLVVQYLTAGGQLERVTGRQLGELATLAAAMLHVLGIDPARTATDPAAIDAEDRTLLMGSALGVQLHRWSR